MSTFLFHTQIISINYQDVTIQTCLPLVHLSFLHYYLPIHNFVSYQNHNINAMKKIFLLQTISLLLISSNIYAQEKISLTLSNKKPSNTQSQIPIDVSIEETTIMILFKENSTYQVIVKGEVGIVYQNFLQLLPQKLFISNYSHIRRGITASSSTIWKETK